MAVLVQSFVAPRAAGVAFTRHPADPQSLLVEAHAGRGQAVVAGEVTPERYTVDRESGVLRDAPPAGCLDAATLEAVVALALRAEALLGAPQDVEWAVGGDGVALLQSRPITVEAEEASDPRVQRLTRANVGEVLPDPVTPLTWTTLGAFLENAFRAVSARAGLLPKDAAPFLVLRHRRLYLNLGLCLEVGARLPGVSAADAERLLLGGRASEHAPIHVRPWALPALARVSARLLRMAAAVPKETAAGEESVRRLVAESGRGSDDPATLRRHLVRFAEVGRAFAEAHVATSGSSAFRLALLGRVLAVLAPGNTADRLNRLVASLADVESASPALALEALAGEARAQPEWLTWLSRSAGGIADAPPALRRRLLAFLDRFGHRALSEGELSAPAWEDDPSPVLEALRTLVAAPRAGDFLRRAAAELRTADEEALVSRLGPLRRALIRWALAGARHGVRERERTKSVAVALVHCGRRLARASARALVARGLLRGEDDVFFLELEELLRALEGARIPAPRVERRRRRHAREGAWPAPREVDLRAAAPPAAGEEHGARSRRGIGVSPGIGRGPARVLRHGETLRLLPGEVLVTPVLDAAFGPLLASAAGAVAEIGGLLSHGSVVARELGVPCVVDVKAATRWITTGDPICVDGRAGEVRRDVEGGDDVGVAPGAAAFLEGEDASQERLHPLEDQALARESVYFNMQDPGAGLALVGSLGVKRTRGEALLAIGLPQGRVLFGLDLKAAQSDERGFAVAGARVEWSPFRLRVETRLGAHEGRGFPPGPVPLVLSPRTVPVSIDLTFAPTTPAVDFCRGLDAAAREALRPLGSYHVEQSGTWRGELVVDGERFAIRGTGSRDHSRGLRDWEAADHWRLFTLRLGDDLAVHALSASVRGRLFEGGFVWRDGRAERITRVLHAAAREDGRVRSLELAVETAAGPPLHLEGTVERTLVVPVQVERRPTRHLAGRPYHLLLHENYTRYETAGRVGYGMAEFTERPP